MLLLKEWWENMEFEGGACYVMGSKSKEMKDMLIEWNKVVFGKMERKWKVEYSRIEELDKKEEKKR